MLTESEVICAVRGYLEKSGYKVSRYSSETEHGIDIEATAPDGTKVTVEAKGETSSKKSTSRFGKSFSLNQVKDHVSKAFYCAARDFSKPIHAAVAFPKNPDHLKCVERIRPALRQLQIEVFWVSSNGTVDVDGNWTICPIG